MILIIFLDYICSLIFYHMGNCQSCIIRKFNSLNKLTQSQSALLSERKTEVSFKKGEVIFSEGSHLNGIYCVRTGNCKMTKLSSNGKDQIVRFVRDGELLGYRSVIVKEPTSLSVTALDDMSACFIAKEDIFEMLNSNPDFLYDIFKSVSRDLKNTSKSLTDMAQKSVRERLAHTILFLDERFGEDEEDAINVHLSREEIANVIGTATESAIRLLSEFKKEGLITLRGKTIIIKDKKRLEKISLGF
ncbi:MAG: Crp/Fnr family transcriptional regulator [Flavobacteriaceae bacterium]